MGLFFQSNLGCVRSKKSIDRVPVELAEVNLFKPQAEGKPTPGISGNAYGAPISFLDRNGDQFIVIQVGRANMPAELVALRLPK